MSFLVPCPDCGRREVSEFSYGGESNKRPQPDSMTADLARYLFFRKNVAGLQVEWWYHRDGCQQWFLARRDTRNNRIEATYWPEDREAAANPIAIGSDTPSL
jgi:heterotetrameric sarcosine oxidase delta subunit